MKKGNRMKRFLLFGYDDYYPTGGMDDFVNSFDSLEECVEEMSRDLVVDRYHVLDLENPNNIIRYGLPKRDKENNKWIWMNKNNRNISI